ncbi:unannotated protein [freshwater metagenome]|uniref:Unannotated protein n=1 Tax=freshwater metagenome TaxID=449393 RepID=A0A6J6S6V4_9ZZZZ
MPPFHSKSTGATRIALMTSAGVSWPVSLDRPRADKASGERSMDFADLE